MAKIQRNINPALETHPHFMALNALRLFVLDEKIRKFLVDNDPKALDQATMASNALAAEVQTTSAEELWIELQERKDGLYQACLRDNPEKWDCGKTPRKAVHNLLQKCSNIPLSSIIRVEFVHSTVP
jgi:hypothetical protein